MTKTIMFSLIAFALGYILAGASFVYGLFPIPQLKKMKHYLREEKIEVPKREIVDCTKFSSGNMAIIVTFGQSNAANFGETPFEPRGNVFNFNYADGKCYFAKDPLLGADGKKGSVWTRVGDKLVSRHVYDTVLLAPIGVNWSSVSEWAPSGRLHGRIHKVLKGLQKKGLTITHLLWHQGERDAARGMSKEEYKQQFHEIVQSIRSFGVEAPIFVSVASICGNMGSDEIRDAQRELSGGSKTIFAGPDTDQLNRVWDRHDSCHFSKGGLERHADLWVKALVR